MSPRNPVILCVDDEEANLKLLEDILVPRGYAVVSAASGKDALLKINSQTIDLVLLDIMMPGMDGFKVCRQIKEDQKLRNIPVILITALSAQQDRILGIEAGAEEFLSKPFDKTEALARIKILLQVKELNDDRTSAEEALQKSHNELDRQVQERTAELAQANVILQADLAELKRAKKALWESEEKYRVLFEGSRDALMTLEPPSWAFTSANHSVVDMFRVKAPEEFSSSAPWDWSPERQPDGRASAEKARDMIETALREGSHFFEWTHQRSDGEDFPAAVLLTRMEHAEGRFLQATIRDLTEAKRAEEVRDKTFRLQQGVNLLQQSLLSVSPLENKLKSVTDSIVRIFGADFCRIWLIRLGDLCGRGCVHAQVNEGSHSCRHRDRCLHLLASSGRYTHTDGPTHRRIPFGRYKIGRIASDEDHKFLTNDMRNDPLVHDHEWAREAGLVSFAGYQLRVSGAETLGVLALFAKHPILPPEDALLDGISSSVALIIQQSLAAEALRESEARFRLVLDNVRDAVWFADLSGHYEFLSPIMAHIYGRPLSEMMANPAFWIEVAHPEDQAAVRASNEALLRDGHVEIEYRIVLPDGTARWISDRKSIVRDEHRALCRMAGITSDITKRKLDEEALRISQEQFHRAQKMEAIGQLAGGMAHDFNNLLTAITCFSDLILSRFDVNPEIGSDVEHIKKAAFRAAKLSRQLLAFTRKQALKLTVLDLNKVVADLSKMLRRVIGEDIDISTDMEPGLKRVKADQSQLEQIIMNLAVNARDAMPTGGKLILRTKNVILGKEDCATFPEAQPGPFVCLGVEDTGQGMDDKTKNHLFEPFFTTKAPRSGTGLGLATVYGIVKQHGGLINVYSEIGQGSAFKIFLPACSLEPEAAGSVEEALPDRFKGRNERILFVEDEESIRNIIGRVLRENRYRIWEAKTSREALELFQVNRGEFDLVFSDVILPDQSGVSLIAQLLTLKPDLKVLFTSGYIDLKEHADFITDNRYPMLGKPYSIATLLRTVRELLDKQEKAPAGKKDGGS